MTWTLKWIVVPRAEPWGPSASVYKISGPFDDEEGLVLLEIELQSGDVIRLTAASVALSPS